MRRCNRSGQSGLRLAELVGLLLVIKPRSLCTVAGPPVVSKNGRKGHSRGGLSNASRSCAGRDPTKDAALCELGGDECGSVRSRRDGRPVVALWCYGDRATRLDARCHAKKAAGASIGTRGVDVSLGAVARAVLAST